MGDSPKRKVNTARKNLARALREQYGGHRNATQALDRKRIALLASTRAPSRLCKAEAALIEKPDFVENAAADADFFNKIVRALEEISRAPSPLDKALASRLKDTGARTKGLAVDAEMTPFVEKMFDHTTIIIEAVGSSSLPSTSIIDYGQNIVAIRYS
ncbi:hypothetical protein [Saccharopolyspora sp. 5N708]|uniref:hypothetical protein n=1 Tax=Saccharopolyspora sp. 5N708 TaxID=3457424 RepID=UPI003FCFA1DA